MLDIQKYPNSPDKISGEFDFGDRAGTDKPTQLAVLLAGQVLASEDEVAQVQAGLRADADITHLMELPGSYAGIVRTPNSLSLLTDIVAQFPFYYYDNGRTVRYSTSAASLAGIVGNELDRHAIGERLIGRRVLDSTWTDYAKVKRIPAASLLHVSNNGAKLSEYESLAPDDSITYDEAVEQLRQSLQEAVRRRVAVSGRLVVDFSGGFDSTSLAFLAVNNISPDATLDIFHRRPGNTLTGDAAYAVRFAGLDTRFRLHDPPGSAEILPYDMSIVHSVELGDLPSVILTSQLGGVMAKLSYLAQIGATDHMVGTGADALLMAPKQYVADLIRNSPFKSGVRILNDILLHAQAAHASPLKIFQTLRRLSRMTAADSIAVLAQKLEGGTTEDPSWHDVGVRSVELLHKTLRSELAEIAYEQSRRLRTDTKVGIADYLAVQEFYASGAGVADLRAFAGRFGIEIQAPYLDRDVARACFQLSAHLRARPNEFKPLLRDALKGIVPDQVFERGATGHFNQQDYYGFIKHASSLRQLLGRASMLAELNIINPAAMERALNQAELGLAAPRAAINQAIAVELWLRKNYGYNQRAQSIPPLPAANSPESAKTTQETIPEEPLQVPDTVRLIKDAAATVSFNLVTGETLLMKPTASAVIEALQERGDMNDAFAALQSLYPMANPRTLKTVLARVISDFMKHGTLQQGDHLPYSITTAVIPTEDRQVEIAVTREKIDTTDVSIQDYARTGKALFSAVRLVEKLKTGPGANQIQFWDLISFLRAEKEGLPYSNPERVSRLLRAGHVLNRFLGCAACVELTTAVVLAEASQGRRVDFAIGIGLLPRQFHAWPVVEGEPVQTVYDEIVPGKYTPFDVW